MRIAFVLFMFVAAALAQAACHRRTCEEVTADRDALLHDSQTCTADEQCGVYHRQTLTGSGCGVIALRESASNAFAERERELVDEADEACDDDESDDLGEAIGEGIGCALGTAFVSDDPNDYQGACTDGACTAVLIIQ
jgi:hypothetical protein